MTHTSHHDVPSEYARPRIVDHGALRDLTAGGPHMFCDGNSGTVGNLGVGNENRTCSALVEP